jgi:hypothetical protein
MLRLPLLVGPKISWAVIAVDLTYIYGKSGELKKTAPEPNIIRHAQVVAKYEDFQRADSSLIKNQVFKKITGFFSHSSANL